MILKYMGFSCEIDDMSQVNCDANVAMHDAREENGDVVNMSRALYLTTWNMYIYIYMRRVAGRGPPPRAGQGYPHLIVCFPILMSFPASLARAHAGSAHQAMMKAFR